MAADKPTRYERHGQCRTKEYRAWCHIKGRCLNPKRWDYGYYGGRGITMCDRWLRSFLNFLADMGEAPGPGYSIDRIDNNGGYSPENCKWATRREQNSNTRRTRWFEYNGERKTMEEWAKSRGMSPTALLYRLKKGWPIDKAITEPLEPGRALKARILRAHRTDNVKTEKG